MADDIDISDLPVPPSNSGAGDVDISDLPVPPADESGTAHAKKVMQIAKDHPFTAMAGLAENALSGVTGGVGNLADAVTGSDPGTHDWAYQPRLEAGKQIAEAGGEETSQIGKKYTETFGSGPMAETLKERIPEALGAVSTVVPLVKGAGALGARIGSGAVEAGSIRNFGASEAARPPTAPTPAVEGPVTAEALRAQPDPLASAAPAAEATPAAEVPPEASAAPEAPARVPVPGKPHIRLKVPATAGSATEPAIEPAAAPTSAGTEPESVRFTAPAAEGASVGDRPAEHQTARLQTMHDLNELAGGQLGEVRTSAVSGNTGETGNDWAHAKVQDAGGKRMQEVIGNETNALRSAADQLVERTGTVTDGVDQPALNRRGTIISKAISGIVGWFDNNIKSMYETAKTRARGVPIQDMATLKNLIGKKSNFYGTTEGEALYRGVQSFTRDLGLVGDDGAFKPATIEQAEQFRQFLGEKWTPRTAGLINKLKDALDEDVARHGGADLFQKARALRAQKGKMLEDPTGIAKLLHPDDRLGINRDVPLNEVPDYVAGLDPEQFNHVLNVLKSAAHLGDGELAEPAAAAIREIKGHMAAKLHDAGSSRVQGGWDAKSFYKRLNDYSLKMPQVFSPKEMKDWKTVNDASNILRMDRTYKGAVVEAHNVGFGTKLREKTGTLARGAVDTGAHAVLGPFGAPIAEVSGISEKVGKWIGGDPEKVAAAKRLAAVEGRITKLNTPKSGNAPSIGQKIGGARQRGGPKFENNASGESSASLEAQNRVAQEKSSGQHRYMLDPDGNVTPLTGVDSVDRKALPGHVIIQRGVGNAPYSVLDRGGMNAREAQGLVARAQGLGKLAAAEREQQTLGQRAFGGRQRGGPKFTERRGPNRVSDDEHFALLKKMQSGTLTAEDQKNLIHSLVHRDPAETRTASHNGPSEVRPTSQTEPLGSRIFGGKQRGAVGNLKASKDEPTTVNIGLNIGDKQGLTSDQVLKVLKAQGVKVKKQTVHQSNTEPTMVATLDKPLTSKQANTVSALLKQDAIAQVAGGKGELYGPKAKEWGPFNRDYFLTHSGERLSANDPLTFKHYSDLTGKSVELDPSFYGKGLKGAERMRIAGGAPKVVSAYGPEGEVEPELRNKTEYSINVPKKSMYDLSADPEGFKQKVRDENSGVYDHSEAERMVKEAGYAGYHLPTGEGIFKGQARFFNKVPATRTTPEPSAEPNKKELPAEHLTDTERSQLRKDTSQKLIDAFHNDLPPVEEYSAAALAGKAKKGWYENSAKAIANVFGPDAPRFSALLASMSPQTSVQANFHNAIRTFINWDKAGRPQSPAAIKSIMEESSMKSEKSNPGGSNVLQAWVPNAVRALTHPEPENMALSGPKVHSFMKNLQDNVNEVTNDAWMAAFSKIDPAAIGGKGGVPGNKRPTYMAMSAKVRAAAKMLTRMTGETWTPREVQETVWSWAKTAYEHADSFGDLATIPELVKHGEITDDLIKSTPDFHNLFSAAEHRSVIGSSRYAGTAEQLANSTGSGASAAGASKKSATAEKALRPHLLSAAERLESVRQSRQAAAE